MRESDLAIVRALESDSSNENTSEPFDKSLRNLSKIVRKQYSASFFTTFSKNFTNWIHPSISEKHIFATFKK